MEVGVGLPEPVRKLVGSWDVYPYCKDNGSEIIKEEYFSKDFLLYMTLGKQEGGHWLSEIFLDEDEGGLVDSMEYFGLDSYKRAYNFLCSFSGIVVRDAGLEDVVSDSGVDSSNALI